MNRFEPSKEMLAIKVFLLDLPPGAYVRYEDIEKATGVPMDTRGKQFLRSAADSAGLQYRVDRGVGIQMESPENAINIATTKSKRVASAVKKANKSTNALLEHHIEKMEQQDRSRLTALASLLGATMAFAKGLEQAYRPAIIDGAKVAPPTLGHDPFSKK